MRVVFMGTPDIACPTLERLVLKSGHEVVGVFTQPDRPAGRGHKLAAPPVKELALDHGIPVFQPTKIKTPETHDLLAGLNPDIAVVAAYGRILPQHLLDTPRLGCLNVHFSLLPKYRGAAPVNWAIANGEALTGVTIMRMDAGLDTGDILRQVECWIGREEDAVALGVRLAHIGADALLETLPTVEDGTVVPIKQDDGAATYAPILKREDGLIDWHQAAETISDRIRGFQPWPGGYTTLDGARLVVWTATHRAGDAGAAPGTLLGLTAAGLEIACGTGILIAREVQAEGRKRLSARDFMNGMRVPAGTVLGMILPGE